MLGQHVPLPKQQLNQGANPSQASSPTRQIGRAVPSQRLIPMHQRRVPFYIRGPGLKHNVVNPGLGSHVDLAGTLVALAGGEVPAISDGQPLPLQASAESGTTFVKPEQ